MRNCYVMCMCGVYVLSEGNEENERNEGPSPISVFKPSLNLKQPQTNKTTSWTYSSFRPSQ